MPVPVMMPSLMSAYGSPKKTSAFVDQNRGIDPVPLASGKLSALLGACEQIVPTKMKRICWGTEGSNPSPSSVESSANHLSGLPMPFSMAYRPS